MDEYIKCPKCIRLTYSKEVNYEGVKLWIRNQARRKQIWYMLVLIYACKQILKEETNGHQWFENEMIQSLPTDSFGQFIKEIGKEIRQSNN